MSLFVFILSDPLSFASTIKHNTKPTGKYTSLLDQVQKY